MGKTAIILGATGLTGGLLLQRLLDDASYGCVKVFGRRSVGVQHPKLKEYLGDIIELQTFADDFIADEVFCCIGTTKGKTKDKALYKAIDCGIPVKAASLCKANGIGFFAVISAMGADANSAIFYNRIKGEMEAGVLSVGVHNTLILRPSLIQGNRQESRLGEGVGNVAMRVLNPLLLGGLRQYRSIQAHSIAAALHTLPNKTTEQGKARVVLSDEIQRIADKA